MKKKLICDKHSCIIEYCDKIIDFSKPIPLKVKVLAKKIKDLAEDALEDGQNMETRLQEYYEAVEDLGFRRTKEK